MPGALEQANADGLEVAELERRLADPIDLPLRWVDTSLWLPTVPTRGYEKQTRVVA